MTIKLFVYWSLTYFLISVLNSLDSSYAGYSFLYWEKHWQTTFVLMCFTILGLTHNNTH